MDKEKYMIALDMDDIKTRFRKALQLEHHGSCFDIYEEVKGVLGEVEGERYMEERFWEIIREDDLQKILTTTLPLLDDLPGSDEK